MVATYVSFVFLVSAVFASSDLEHQVKKLAKTLDKVQKDYSVIKRENNLIRKENVELRHSVSQLAGKIDKYNDINTLAFTAYATDDAVYDVNTTLQFGSVVLNYGGGYDPSTSIFTVPTSGLYIFMTSVTIDLHQHFTGSLMHNSSPIGRMEADAHYNENLLAQSSVSEVIYCLEGDSVYVMMEFSDLGQSTIKGSVSSSFSGHLIEFYVET